MATLLIREKKGLNYKYEKNNQIISGSTNPVTTEFSLLENFIEATPSSGFQTLKSVDVRWSVGVGGFLGYRVYIKRVDSAQTDACSFDIKQCSFVNSPSGCDPYDPNTGEGCLEVDSSKNQISFSGLEDYYEYQVVVAACGESDYNNNFLSDKVNVYTYPKLAAFEGISEVESPEPRGYSWGCSFKLSANRY